MSDEMPEPLDAELAQLFAAEARFSPEPPARQARVWQGVSGAVLALPIASATPSAAGHALASAKVVGTGKLLGLGAALFIAGGVTGAAVYRATVEPTVVYVREPAPPMPVVTQLPLPEALPAVDAAVPVAPRIEVRREQNKAAPRHAESEPESENASELAKERAIIDVARAAIAGDNTDSALLAIERHAREFPHGSLAEEREGLRVLALSRAGRAAEAAEMAARFRRAHPHSLLLPAIDSALEK